jgi:tetratricopeptide (TPR) repeat protein
MPVRQIGGIARANLNGVVNLSRRGNTLVTALNVNSPIAGASIRILDGSRIAFEQSGDLTPEHVWTHELALSEASRKYTFELRDSSAGILLRHTEGEYDWDPKDNIHVGPQPSYRVAEVGKRTDGEWLQLGKDQELNGKLLVALDTYQQGLTRYPVSFGLLKAAGRLSATLLRFDESVRYLEPVHARDTSDPEISYYLGIAYDGAGNLRAARNAFEAAQRMPQFRSAGAVRLAELLAREGDLHEAVRYIDEASNGSPDDVRVAEEWVILHRVLSDKQAASFARFPLSYLLPEELGKPDLAHLAGDANRVLEIAAAYMRLGQYRSALAVLSRAYPEAPPDQMEPGAIAPDKHPLVAYFRAYSKEKLGERAGDEYAAASRLPTQYVFPAGNQALEVLRAAVRANPNDATAHYLLGTLYFSIGLTDPALEHWERARTNNAKIPVLAASMGLALLHLKHDPQRALDAFREGLAADLKNPRIYEGMEQALSVLKSPARERVEALEHYPDFSHMPTPLVYELALNRAEANDYEGAAALFRNRFFAREEGGTNVREVWVEVRLLQAQSLARAGQCEAALSQAQTLTSKVPGLDFTGDGLEPIADSARTQYLLGMLDSDCGRAEEAASRFERVAGNSPEELFWAYAAAKKRNGFSETAWREKLEAALARAKASGEAGFANSSRAYSMGLIELALGHREAAGQAFQQALLLQDRNLAHHLSRLMQDGLY